jgi:chemotaxis methyl-accepting protein methylase
MLGSSVIDYRHVVFPDADAGYGVPVNFSPTQPIQVQIPPINRSLSPDESECVQWLFGKVGLRLEDYRPETVKRRLPACTRALRVGSMREVRSVVTRHPDLLQTAISALVIGVSSFFRDPAVFACIRDEILPQMLGESPAPRIWSAGCSEGAELYSIAMLLAERGALQNSDLLGTDCRSDAIHRAKAGSFAPDGILAIPEETRSRYFACDGRAWRANSSLRTAIQWRCASVLEAKEPGGWDLILCRNMAIYMQPRAASRLWAQLQQCLRPGGVLVLGKAERPHGAPELKPIAPCIYRRDRS